MRHGGRNSGADVNAHRRERGHERTSNASNGYPAAVLLVWRLVHADLSPVHRTHATGGLGFEARPVSRGLASEAVPNQIP